MHSLGLKVVRLRASELLADPEGSADALMHLCIVAAGPSTTQANG
jgi:hypothetical protein